MLVLNILFIHLGLHLMNLLLLKSGIYPLGGNGLPAVCSTIADDQTAEISQETENDNAKDNNQERPKATSRSYRSLYSGAFLSGIGLDFNSFNTLIFL